MTSDWIAYWLSEEDPAALETLWAMADRVRRERVGDAVHLRGLAEVSNHCVRGCAYCGLRAANRGLIRYRMTRDEVLRAARRAVSLGYGTLVLQAGEDPALDAEWVEDVVRRVKRDTPLAVTLSLGERPRDELARWRDAGADRYLLRFETSDPDLYEALHPGGNLAGRLAQMDTLRGLGYEVGTGMMVGLPGQRPGYVVRDLLLLKQIDPDMIGIGPFIPHPDTPLGGVKVEGALLAAFKAIALARIICPETNIPATTALATLDPVRGRELALMRGANVVMPNVTPTARRKYYELYPDKVCIEESASDCGACLRRRIESVGRTVAEGRGDSPAYGRRFNLCTAG